MAQVESSGAYFNTQKKCRVFKTKDATVSNNYSGHSGVDVTADGGFDYVVAHSVGTVVECERNLPYNNPGSSGTASYGNYVKLRHANGYVTVYAHLARVTVSQGQTVAKGQSLGYMGNSGNSYGAHLHFEVRDKSGNSINFAAKNYLHADLPGLPGGGSRVTADSGSAGGSGGGSEGVGSNGNNNTGNAASTLTGAGASTKKDITKVVVKSVTGNVGTRDKSLLHNVQSTETPYEVLLQNSGKVYAPVLVDHISLEWQRKGAPGALSFTAAVTPGLKLEEGDPVSLRVHGKTVFFGYVFEKSRSDPYSISVKAYDQMRYLKNKGTLAYSGKTYTEVLQMLAKDYALVCGTLEDTKYKIPQRVEDGTLFDMLGNASDQTVIHTGKLFVLYDDCGKLTLRSIENMMLPLLVDADTTESYSYATTIDRDVYTRITLAGDNGETGERELYVLNTDKQSQWGVLQYYEALNDASAAKLKETAKLLGSYYGKLRRTLSLSGCLGDIRVRGGSSLVVQLDFGDYKLQNYMVVESVKHTFENGQHRMDLTVSGVKGEFTA